MGQIQGYFGGGEPDELFWRLYSLYTAMALVSSMLDSVGEAGRDG
ncbi:hypothetical protein [Paenibacillus xylanilyticus]|nr:hypothetical protein [Paenibacillus xylanilyticus]